MLTREQLKSIYEKALAEGNHPASDEVQTADGALNNAITDYVIAIQEDTFCWAYELGFKAGKEATK